MKEIEEDLPEEKVNQTEEKVNQRVVYLQDLKKKNQTYV